MKALSKTQQELLNALRQGVVVHFMPNEGRFSQSAYYFRSDTHQYCTAAAYALCAKGYAEKYDGDWRGHKLRAKGESS